MKVLYSLLLTLLLSRPLRAQDNYIATSPVSATPGARNVITGVQAGNTTMTGTDNTFVGYQAGQSNTTGQGNIFVGIGTGKSNKQGNYNTFLGINAGQKNISGTNNSFIGSGAGLNNTTGSTNAFIGNNAGYSNTGGYNNAFIGTEAGYSNTGGYNNAFIGTKSGFSNTGGYNNAFIGYVAGYSNTTGRNNAFIGYQAGVYNTEGIFNAFVGNQAGLNNTTGNANTFVGNDAGQKNTTGSDNTFVGSGAGLNNTTGQKNTYFGNDAGNNSKGDNNAFFGIKAGFDNTTGSNNTMLGFNTQPTSGTLQNTVAIGANATVARSNAIVLGDPANTSVAVGIGTNNPQFPLDVRGVIRLQNSGTIKFTHLLNPTLRNGMTDQFLTVNEEGETVLARHQLRIDNVNQWSDKVFAKGYALKSLAEIETHIQRHGHLPNVPSAVQVVKDGIDPAKMDATLLEKIEELTLYSIKQEKENQKLKARVAELAKGNQTSQQQIDELKALVKQLLEKK
ncbi:hypothetical protein GCM10027592_57340 [Spirosoma flavus]